MAPALTGGMIVTLAGDLGTGKTTLVRGLLRARGIEGAVKSPTYTLVEHYLISSLYFYHFDFYRFTNQNEWDSAGMSDYFRSDAVCIVEWPERAGGTLPPPDLLIQLAHEGEGRRVAFSGPLAAGLQALG